MIFTGSLDYMSGCLQMLKETRAIDTMYFRVDFHLGLYDPNSYRSECQDIIEAINRSVLHILKHLSKMELQELEFSSD